MPVGRPPKHPGLNRSERYRYEMYGLSPKEHRKILKEQNNVCAICGGNNNGRALAIDHDHDTGYIRGLLCTRCNMGLGCFLDDIRLLAGAIVYLEDHGAVY